MTTATAAPARYMDVLGRKIRVFPRHEFLTRRWRYKAGEHVTFLAPSQDGKTTLAFQLLKYTAKPTLPATAMVMKPRDATPAVWTRHLGYIETPTWPPPPRPFWRRGPQPSGYTLWPPHTFRTAEDKARLTAEFRSCLEERYAHGDCIVFADEVYGISAELGLADELVAIWSRGGGMGVGLWGATQRPAGTQGKGVPGFMYSNAIHLFLSRDPDQASQQRYGEIGGVDPKRVKSAVSQLRRHQFLYIGKGDEKGGPYMCVIEAK